MQYFVWFFMLFCLSCQKPTSSPKVQADEEVDHQSTLTSKNKTKSKKDKKDKKAQTAQDTQLLEAYRSYKFSRFDLDEPKMAIHNLTQGLKDFIGAKTPFISYAIPKDADYVEIMRCDKDAKINTGTSTVSIEDTNLSDSSDWMRSEDLFANAVAQGGCTIVNLGHVPQEYVDSYAPSGSYRYFVHACVAKERMIDTESLTSRNCSTQVSLSNALTFQNIRSDTQKSAVEKLHVYEAKIDNIISGMRILAEDTIQATKVCEDREAKKAVSVAKKQAWITLIATPADIAIELISYTTTSGAGAGASKIMAHYFIPTSGGRIMDMFGMFGALGGMTFRDTFINLLTGSEDIPRSCAELLALQKEMEKRINSMGEPYYWLAYYSDQANDAIKGMEAQSSAPQ